ncbi:hypothetical protein A3J56_03195 [Candidatus Giovannonibacteria bacterium RIFCSPHIGHO2_02_FULL_46_20]|uniref:Probable endolytic peptidoglycan transglycosylase RlpA n=1 Tax=Candidatus Giovannonibacteria bacterium RIFCSPHIGHO2_02_FULL_46_20 TaxID=1798338 RepID=A0A1F5WGE8_9BACT|nr:MAG: hypothetical protein A3J56_03195 [Candidatus Giovannonibacteria bacterium RIFCSPHIGHO2_02_FULL_46_20]
MTRRVAIAIWILGLFVVGAPHPALAADYYIIRSGDMLYRVPHSAHRTFFNNGVAHTKHTVVSRRAETGHRESMSSKPQIAKASWYGPGFHGETMANGERFDMHDIFIAHKKLPLGTCVRVKNPKNGRVVQAPISDRGPYIPGRKLDLSCYAMGILGGIESGVIPVKYQIIPGLRWCDPSATVDDSILAEARRRCWEESAQKN